MYDPSTQGVEVVSWLQRARWYATVATLADGDLLVVGGMQQVTRACALTSLRRLPCQ